MLLSYSVAVAAPDDLWEIIAGGLIGVGGGIAVGVTLYAGLMKIPVARLFTVTNWMGCF